MDAVMMRRRARGGAAVLGLVLLTLGLVPVAGWAHSPYDICREPRLVRVQVASSACPGNWETTVDRPSICVRYLNPRHVVELFFQLPGLSPEPEDRLVVVYRVGANGSTTELEILGTGNSFARNAGGLSLEEWAHRFQCAHPEHAEHGDR